MGQMNIANVSETSLRLLYSKQDNKAKKVYQVLREGIKKRHECIRKLLALQNKKFTDEVFYGLDFHFTPSRPVDNYSLLEELAIQRSMGAISIQTIIEQSPYTVDVAVEMQRLKDEAATGLNQGYSLDPILDNARRRRLGANNGAET